METEEFHCACCQPYTLYTYVLICTEVWQYEIVNMYLYVHDRIEHCYTKFGYNLSHYNDYYKINLEVQNCKELVL